MQAAEWWAALFANRSLIRARQTLQRIREAEAAMHGLSTGAESELRIAGGEDPGTVRADILFRVMQQTLQERRSSQ